MKIIYTLIVMLFSFGVLQAQNVELLYESYLTSNNVTSVDEAADGRLIIAAYGSGVNEKNGDVWTFQSIESNIYVNVVKASPDGSYWIGGNNWGGLQQVKEGVLSQKLVSLNISDIVVETENKLWLASTGDGVILYENGDTTQFTHAKGNIPSDYVTSMAKDSQGNIWVGTNNGIAKFDGSAWTQWTTANSAFPVVRIEDIAIDLADNVWLAARDSGVVSFDGTTFTRFFVPEGRVKSLCKTLTVDANGVLWAAVMHDDWLFHGGINGLVTYANGQWSEVDYGGAGGYAIQFQVAESIRFLKAIGGRIYLGSGANGGLQVLENGKWSVYQSPKFPRDIAFDSEGSMWVVSDGTGILKYTDGQWTEYNCFNTSIQREGFYQLHILNDSVFAVGIESSSLTLLKDSVLKNGVPQDPYYYYSMIEGKNDTLWLGAMDGGLRYYIAGQVMCADTAINQKRILEMAYDATDNSVWFSGFDTLFHWRDTVIESFVFADHGFANISGMVVDANGVLWIATYNGLVKWDGQNWHTYTTENSDLSYQMVDVITIDSKENIWLGLRNASIVSFDRNDRWVTYGYEEYGLPSWQMTCMSVDANDNIYAGYWQTGVVKLNPTAISLQDNINVECDLLLCPNPVQTSFSVRGSFSASNTLKLFSLSGRQLLHRDNVQQGQIIEVSSLKRGLYFVEIKDDLGHNYRIKWVKD